jgi:hypothetical protein
VSRRWKTLPRAGLQQVADWTAGPEAFQDERVIWKAIDAIENVGGRFLCRKGGLGEQVQAKRAAYLTASPIDPNS